VQKISQIGKATFKRCSDFTSYCKFDKTLCTEQITFIVRK